MGFVVLLFTIYLFTASLTLECVASRNVPNEKLVVINNNLNWNAIAKNGTRLQQLGSVFDDDLAIQFQSDKTRSRRSYVDEQDEAVRIGILKLLKEGKQEDAYLLYSKAIEEKEKPYGLKDGHFFTLEVVLYIHHKQLAIRKILDFIRLELNRSDQICLWLEWLFDSMKLNNQLATFDGLLLGRITKRLAILNENSDQKENCNLKPLANRILNEITMPLERLVAELAKSIQSGKSDVVVSQAKNYPLEFDSIVQKLIPMAVGLKNTDIKTYTNLAERLKNTISFISSLSPSTTVVDALTCLNEILQNAEPHFLPISECITLIDDIKQMLATVGSLDHLPSEYIYNFKTLKSLIPVTIEKVFSGTHVFIYKNGRKKSEAKKYMTANKFKRYSSKKGFTRFDKSNTTEESNQWILEPINNDDYYRIKNMETGEYLYADDDSSPDGFPNKRSVFTYKLDNESDVDSLGNRAIWVVSRGYEIRDERFIITNFHWKEYLDSHEAPLNEVYTWRDKVKPPLTTNHWVISDEHGVERHQITRLVCYFDSMSVKREGAGRFTVNNIDPSLCTHLIYSKARTDNNTFVMKIGNQQIDVIGKGYEKIIALKQKNPQLKVLISLGGWNIDDKYKRLHSDPHNIRKFVESTVSFLQKYKFDGIHFDLQLFLSADYKESMISLLTTLNSALRSNNYLLSATVNPLSLEGYDLVRLNEILDFVSVMTFRYHGNWESRVRHHAPLQSRDRFNADFVVNNLIREGVSPHKIVVGIPFFGTTWKLQSNHTAPKSPGSQGAQPGKIMKYEDQMAYYEICEVVQNYDWQVFQDHDQLMGPYAVSPIESNKNRTWVGYDDPAMAIVKANYILSRGLGGAHVLDISMDDFHNTCGDGVNPMLSAIANTFGIKTSNITWEK